MHHDHRLLPRLHHEWNLLRHQPSAIGAVRSWGLTDRSFSDLDEFLALCGFERPGTTEREALLRAVVLRAANDPLAGRIALQRIVPGLLAIVRRRHQLARDTEVFEELVGAAWITIREFDPARRPACLAAALLAGADYRAFGRMRRRFAAEREVLTAHEVERADDVSPAHLSPCDELAALVHATRLDGASEEDLRIVRELVEVGSPSALAERLGVTPRTVRNRRDRVTARMRRVALAA